MLFCKVRLLTTIEFLIYSCISIHQHPATKRYDLSSVRYCMVAAAPVSAELTAQLLEVFPGVQLGQGYGTPCICPIRDSSHSLGDSRYDRDLRGSQHGEWIHEPHTSILTSHSSQSHKRLDHLEVVDSLCQERSPKWSNLTAHWLVSESQESSTFEVRKLLSATTAMKKRKFIIA